jgi:hypothetical protein
VVRIATVEMKDNLFRFGSLPLLPVTAPIQT